MPDARKNWSTQSLNCKRRSPGQELSISECSLKLLYLFCLEVPSGSAFLLMCVLVIMTGWPSWVFMTLVSKSITGTPQLAWPWCFVNRGHRWDPAGLRMEAEFFVPSHLLPYTNIMLFTLIL